MREVRKFARRGELRRIINTVDGECVGARAPQLGDVLMKRIITLAIQCYIPCMSFTVDSLHGSCFQLKRIYLLKRFSV